MSSAREASKLAARLIAVVVVFVVAEVLAFVAVVVDAFWVVHYSLMLLLLLCPVHRHNVTSCLPSVHQCHKQSHACLQRNIMQHAIFGSKTLSERASVL